jgi:hypothetical protein
LPNLNLKQGIYYLEKERVENKRDRETQTLEYREIEGQRNKETERKRQS